MALVVADRVQETTTTSGTGTLSLDGAVAGFRSFVSGVGSTNTTFYTIYDQIAQAWEVGIGTVTSGSPDTLSRTTVLSNSLGTTAKINLAGNTASVFCTYPAEKSVNLDASGNVTTLGTIASGTWNGTTIGVAYGGTGVTSSSGSNSVVLRDANQNISVNRLNQTNTDTTASASTTSLTAASSYSQTLIGTGNHTFQMPDATTLTTGVAFIFNNNATGTLTLTDYATATIGTVTSGGACELVLLANGTVAGTWDVHGFLPENVTWGTNALNLGSTVITNGTWNGGTIGTGYGGTGLTTFTAANYALYSTSSSALTAGTLPVVAGGTGQTTFTDGQLLIGNTSGNTLTKSTLTAGTGVSITNGNGSISISATGLGGTVTSVSFTGGIISVANATTTPALTVAGTSGGIPYFSSGTTWASSAALAANAIVLGGGAGAAPATTTTGTGVVTAIGNNTNAASGLAVLNASGYLAVAQGGTNSNATPTAGGVGYGTGTAYAFTSAGTTGQALLSNAASAPAFGNLGTSAGGTGLSGATPFTANGVMYASSTSVLATGSALTFNATTGDLTAPQVVASNGILETTTTINTSYTIASGNNGLSVGPVTVASGKAITVSSGQRWVVL